MITASIDLGSNSLLLCIARMPERQILEDHSAVVALGKNLLKTKVFNPEGKRKVIKILQSWIPLLQKYGLTPGDVRFVTTESARVATDAKDFFEKEIAPLGYNVEIISDKEESYFAALGLTWSLKKEDTFEYICDLGGASTEIIRVQWNPFKIIEVESLKVGSVTYVDMDESRWNIIQGQVENLKRSQKIRNLRGIAGTFTSLACIFLGLQSFDANQVEGYVMEKEKLLQLNYDIENFPYLKDRKQALESGRELILKLMDLLEIDSIQVSTFGIRHGIILAGELG